MVNKGAARGSPNATNAVAQYTAARTVHDVRPGTQAVKSGGGCITRAPACSGRCSSVAGITTDLVQKLTIWCMQKVGLSATTAQIKTERSKS